MPSRRFTEFDEVEENVMSGVMSGFPVVRGIAVTALVAIAVAAPASASADQPMETDRLAALKERLRAAKAGQDLEGQPVIATSEEKADKVEALEKQIATLEEQAKQAKAAGADEPSASKNVSIVAGAVVLNPFELNRSDDPDDPDDPVTYRLDTGSTEANFLVEVGFRRRWAWLDFVLIDEVRQRLDELEDQIGKLKERAGKREKKIDASEAGVVAKENEELEKLKQERKRLERRFGTLLGNDAANLPSESFFSPKDLWMQKEQWGMLIPDDWTVRLGFATGSSTPSGAASLAGAGDFYIEGGLGWNLLRFTIDDSGATDNGLGFFSAPIRGALSLEGNTSWSNDPDLNDIHQRWLVGASLSLGVPISLSERKATEPIRVWEVMIRMGAAEVEIPDYLDRSTNEVRVSNNVPDFTEAWGLGLDAELNVPVSVGYLTFRGTMNTGFDPNPWTATVGYTLPLSGIVDIVTGGSKKPAGTGAGS